MKVAELNGPALDGMVAEVEGVALSAVTKGWVTGRGKPAGKYSPSTDWSQGGELIDRYNIELNNWSNGYGGRTWLAWLSGEERELSGATALVAICRAIVAAELGDVVSVPAELVQAPNCSALPPAG